MEKVFREAVRLLERGDPFVTATVVSTMGSTPQKPGSKLLVRKDGSGVGTLGGGCVEGDIWFAAQEALREGTGPQHKDYLLNEDIAARDGLVCGGTMYFLIEPFRRPEGYLEPARSVVEAYEGGQPVAIASLVRPSEKGQVGDRLFIRGDGTTTGSLGDEQRDRDAAERAARLAPYGKHEYVTLPDGGEYFLETYASPPTLVIAGGGHIGKCIAPLAKSVGLRVFVIDDREEFCNPERFPEAERTVVAPYHEGIGQLPIAANTAVVVATRGHRFDDLALEAAARSPAEYVGLVGSKRKGILIYQELLRRGVSAERLRQVHSPVGLDLGGRTPEEIALGIVAEVLAVRNEATAQPMKMASRYVDQLAAKQKGRDATAATAS